MRFIILRHAETEYNELGLMQGKRDIPIGEKGIKHAIETRKKLSEYDIDFTISSPLARAKMTASLVSDAPILTDERIIERDLGSFEGKTFKEFPHKEYYDLFLNKDDNGVESIQNVYNRIKSLLDHLKKYQDKTILLVTHGAIIRILPYYFEGFPEDGVLYKKNIGNCEFIEFSC